MTAGNGRGITVYRLAIAFFVVLGIYLLRDSWLPQSYRSYTPKPKTQNQPTASEEPLKHTQSEEQIHHDDAASQPSKTPSESCAEVPGADNVMVMLKTGATELYEKLPPHFVTTFKCVPHFMIFSDLEQSFADYPVYDALEEINKTLKDANPDFELYRKLQQYKREGQDMSNLKGTGSWNLDKWKFLPMMHKAFTTAGDNIDWFVIIEADTSLSWTNLLQFLTTMDPKKEYYLGSQNMIQTTQFAHGGSGVIFSRGAANALEATRERRGRDAFDQKWEQITTKNCCGDKVLAETLLFEEGIPLTPAWPVIQGETPSSLDWTDKHWCAPAVSWHHVSAIEIDSLWQFERAWVDTHGWDKPYLYRDVFAHFVERHITVNRTKWNNDSKGRKFATPMLATKEDEDWGKLLDYEQEAVQSEEACAQACIQKKEDECIQWMYSPGRCYLDKVIRFGKSDERKEEHWTSGWIQERIEKLKEKHRDCDVRWHG